MRRFTALLLAIALLFVLESAAGETGYPVLRIGSSGDAVLTLQSRLILLGLLSGAADGTYGSRTGEAVAAAQTWLSAHGHPLVVDGVAGLETQTLLYDDSAMQALLDLSVGDSGMRVANLQSRLIELNFLDGNADGVFGAQTEAAVKAFQAVLAANGVDGVLVSGIADEVTRGCLTADLSGFGITAPEFFDSGDPLKLTADYVYARACVLVNADTGEILLQKNADRRMFPASTTKIMTLLLALEKGNLDKVVTIPASAADVPGDSSLVPVFYGERMTLRDLLYGLMLRSGNDAANAVAEIICGSVDTFVAEMNRKAQELGMTGTHYANPHGYHDPEHYTTARDMALLSLEAMRSGDFRAIVTCREYTMAKTALRGELKITNGSELLNPLSRYYYSGAYGIKKGYTFSAGFCYSGAAARDGRTLIAIVLGCPARFKAWTDMARLFSYGFARLQ
jgi:D-alanyl-D-alanine carboxypeptidase